MTTKELNDFKLDFTGFIAEAIYRYRPSEAELGIMYTLIIHLINDEINHWFFEGRDNEREVLLDKQ